MLKILKKTRQPYTLNNNFKNFDLHDPEEENEALAEGINPWELMTKSPRVN